MPSFRSVGVSCFVVFCSLVLGLPAAGGAAQDASVSGTLTANGKTVALPYVYAYALEEGFYQDDDPAWVLIFVEHPIEERDVDEHVWDSAFVEIRITKTAEFDDEPTLQAYSQSLRFSADQGGNISGGAYPEVDLEITGPERFAGRVHLPEAQTIFDDTFQYDFTFSAPLSDPNAPIGEPLPGDGGEPGQAYIAWVNAIHSGDVEQLKALVPAEVAEQFDSPEAKEEIEMMQSMTPTEQKILGGSSDGQTALLQVEGVMEGETVQGEITLEKVGDHWRATTASW
jgi:hypothetical protein